MSKKNRKPETSATDATDATGATGAASLNDAFVTEVKVNTDALISPADAAKSAEKARERAAAATDGIDGMLNRFVVSLVRRWVNSGDIEALELLGFEQVDAFGSKVVIHRDQSVFRRISAVARLHGFAVKARLIENMGEKLRILEDIKRDDS